MATKPERNVLEGHVTHAYLLEGTQRRGDAFASPKVIGQFCQSLFYCNLFSGNGRKITNEPRKESVVIVEDGLGISLVQYELNLYTQGAPLKYTSMNLYFDSRSGHTQKVQKVHNTLATSLEHLDVDVRMLFRDIG